MRPAKLRTFDYLGCHAYSLTFCTFQRQRHFIDAVVGHFVMHEILLSVGRSPVAHLLSFAKLARQRSAMTFSRRTGGRLWQQGFFERTLRNDEAIEVVARYIEGR
jgi:REP element-mobilizing transposase RayT